MLFALESFLKLFINVSLNEKTFFARGSISLTSCKKLGWDFLDVFLNFYPFIFLERFSFPFFNLSIFSEADGTTITNEDRKEFEVRKNAKMYSNL